MRTLSGAGPVQDVVFSPDGTHVAGTVHDDVFTVDDTTDVSMVPIWDVRTGEVVTTLRDVGDLTTNVVYSPNGRLLVTAASSDDDSTITVWGATSGVKRLAFDVDHTVMQVGFSPDGRVLATGGWGGDVAIWDTTAWRRLRSLPPHDQMVSSMAFTPDGHLLTGSYDGTAKLWDVKTGERLLTLRGHAAGVAGVAVSTDGTRLATASRDSTVKIWDTNTGRLQLTLHGHEGGVYGVAFSPDGRLLASSSPDGTVTLHLLPTDELLKLARNRVTRSLTDDECRQYLQVPRCRDRA